MADWSIISDIKGRLKIPVIGNGDVFKPSVALKMKTETGCDGVMIGRGAVGNPWIFEQILCLNIGRPIQRPNLSERRRLMMEHYGALSDSFGPHRAALCMRGLLLRYTKGLPHSGRFRGLISKVKDFDSLISTMDLYFSMLNDEG